MLDEEASPEDDWEGLQRVNVMLTKVGNPSLLELPDIYLELGPEFYVTNVRGCRARRLLREAVLVTWRLS